MAPLAGYGGKVVISAATVAEIGKWSMDAGRGLKESGAFGDAWEESIALRGKWSGSFEGLFDPADTNGHVALKTAALNGTTVSLKLYINDTNYYSGTAYVELSTGADVGDAVTASYKFTGSGTLSYT